MALDRPFSDPAALLDPGRVYEFRDEIAAEGAPQGAVLGGVDGAFTDAEYETDGGVGRAAGEERALLDEGFVDEVGTGYDD